MTSQEIRMFAIQKAIVIANGVYKSDIILGIAKDIEDYVKGKQ